MPNNQWSATFIYGAWEALRLVLQHQLDDALAIARWKPKLLNFQPDGGRQLLPLFPRPLQSRRKDHHLYVVRGLKQIGALIGQDDLIEKELGIAFLHGRGDMLKDRPRLVIVPVMNHKVKKVAACACAQVSEQIPLNC